MYIIMSSEQFDKTSTVFRQAICLRYVGVAN